MTGHAGISLADRMRLAGVRLRDGFQAFQAETDRRRGAPHLAKIFRRQLGYDLDLERPRTFNEKIQWRKLFDRHAEYPIISDKLRLRDWVAARLGTGAPDPFVRLYAATDDPGSIDFDGLPGDLVLKANHGSGWNIILREDDGADRARTVQTCREWLAQKFNRRKHEWAYWPIPPRIVVEELVLSTGGGLPADLKLLMFDGVCRVIQFDELRQSGAHRRIYMTADWEDAGFLRGKVPKAERPARPERWGDILGIAERLSRGFDFIRVDFLLFGERFALNEMTAYSGGGLEPFHPGEADRELGDLWRLPDGGA